jgi:alpha-beta hydrolase superfamily lysophospholipase
LAAEVLNRTWASLQLSNEIDESRLSHDKNVCEAYRMDRLVHNKITPRLYSSMVETMNQAAKRGEGISVPLLMMVPLEDRITDPDAALRFFKNLKHRDKELKTYPGFYHESLNELEKQKPFEDLRSWIQRHSATS